MRVLIAGDSWSQGEWGGSHGEYGVVHQGMHQYLLDDGYEVFNVGRGGYHNFESFDAVTQFDQSFDHLIFFYTDPLRVSKEDDIKNIPPQHLIAEHKQVIYRYLEQIKNETHAKITLIGGCVKFIGDDTNIDYLIPSVTELLIPNFVDNEYLVSQQWRSHFLAQEKTFNIQQKTQWLEILTQADNKFSVWGKNPEYFWPDGYHMNRKGAKIVYEKLKELWFNEV